VSSTTPLLEVRGATKRYPGVLALRDVNLSLGPSEVLAVIGENGAGKSTLMKVLAGIQQLDAGEILLDGKPIRIRSVQASLDLGVALIHQELNLCENLDVAANIFLGREPLRHGLIHEARAVEASRKFLQMVGLDISPRTPLQQLTIGRRQLVEIAKALSINARVLIMDEPTSSLTQHETENLFEVVDRLRERGVSMVYISHRLGEVKRLADRVMVLRDGENAGEISKQDITHDKMVGLMVGRDVSRFYDRHPHPAGDVALAVDQLRTRAHPGCRLSFQVRAGEIVGVAGLVGAGRTELLETLFGVERPLGGTIKVRGEKTRFRAPREAIAAGVALAPEDRKQHGLILEASVEENIGMAGWFRHRLAGGFFNRRRQVADAQAMIEKLNIKTPHARQMVLYLSGGNQQKVVLGKWLALAPRVLLLDEPTRGIDVGAKEEIYHLMDRLAAEGVAILFASSEMEEVLGVSDRVLVMHQGSIAGELARSQLTEEAVMRLATGAEPVTVSNL